MTEYKTAVLAGRKCHRETQEKGRHTVNENFGTKCENCPLEWEVKSLQCIMEHEEGLEMQRRERSSR